ncbi:MAG: ankyrin repeat domain-containing protein [Verrucomicrobia bacterium]|nr:ankyrin repeat domain-containing protein [Verrucomicrobiota bacterium]
MAHFPLIHSNLGPFIKNEDETPLHLAAKQGKIEEVEKLLKAGARDEATNKKGWLAADIARMEGHHRISNLLQLVKRHGYPLPSDIHVGDVDYWTWKQIDRCVEYGDT